MPTPEEELRAQGLGTIATDPLYQNLFPSAVPFPPSRPSTAPGVPIPRARPALARTITPAASHPMSGFFDWLARMTGEREAPGASAGGGAILPGPTFSTMAAPGAPADEYGTRGMGAGVPPDRPFPHFPPGVHYTAPRVHYEIDPQTGEEYSTGWRKREILPEGKLGKEFESISPNVPGEPITTEQRQQEFRESGGGTVPTSKGMGVPKDAPATATRTARNPAPLNPATGRPVETGGRGNRERGRGERGGIPPELQQLLRMFMGGMGGAPGFMNSPMFGILNAILRSQGGGGGFPFADTTARTDGITQAPTRDIPTPGGGVSTVLKTDGNNIPAIPPTGKGDRVAPGSAAGGGAAPAANPVTAAPAVAPAGTAAPVASAAVPPVSPAPSVPAVAPAGDTTEDLLTDPLNYLNPVGLGSELGSRFMRWMRGTPDGGTADVPGPRSALPGTQVASTDPTAGFSTVAKDIPHEEQTTTDIRERPQFQHEEAAAAAYGASSYTNVPERILHGARRAAMLGGPGAVFAFMRKNGYPRHGAWCGDFAAAVMSSEGLPVPRQPWVASNWRNWGTPARTPQPGDIAVRRGVPTGAGGSHVMMVERVFPDGSAIVIGGNQRHGIRQHVSARYFHHFDYRRWPNPHGPSRYATIQ